MRRFLLRVWRWLRAEIVLGFLIASVFWTGVLGWQAAYAPTDAEKQKCHDDAKRIGYKAEECKSIWERTTSDPVAFFTLWLVIFTGGLTVSTVLLWRAGEKQFRHARRSAAIQSRDMQASIAAANEANRISSKSLHSAQRPWVSVVAVTPIGMLDFSEGIKISFEIDIRNSGQTPATNVNWGCSGWSMHMGGTPQELQAKFTAELIESRASREQGNHGHLLVPGIPLKRAQPYMVSWDLKDDKRRFSILVVGCIDYRYPSGGSYHQTGFMFQLMRQKTDGLPKGFGIRSVTFDIGEKFAPDEVEFRPFTTGFFATDSSAEDK
jgi:hypothetical protein